MGWYFLFACIPLIGIIYQDFKHRQIYGFWPPLIFLIFFIDGLQQLSFYDVVRYSLFNSLFVIVNLLMVSLYFSIKEKRMVNIFMEHFGIGDFLFFLALTPAFSPFNFILFFVISLIIIGLVHLILIIFGLMHSKTIPLAGWLAITVMLFWLLNAVFFEINPLNDDQLINYIYFGADNRDNPFY